MTPLLILTLWLFIGISTFVFLLFIDQVMLSYFHLIFITISGPVTPLFLLWTWIIEKLENHFNPTDLRGGNTVQFDYVGETKAYESMIKTKIRSKIIGILLCCIIIVFSSYILFTGGESNGAIPLCIGIIGLLFFISSKD